MKRSRTRKGFTLVELLVVVGIIALLVTILMPTLSRAMELAKRSICGANQNSIGKQIAIYKTEQESFPLLYRYGDSGDAISISTMSDDIWDKATLGTNAMQNVWLLIKYGASEKLFQCPSDGDYIERDKTSGLGNNTPKKYGWISKNNYSYGLQKPYNNNETDSGSNANQAPLTSDPDQGSFIILADKNGRSRTSSTQRPGYIYWQTDSNCNVPSNHKDDGFNCLSWQGSVKFYKAKIGTTSADCKAGVNDDEIYCNYGNHQLPISADANPKYNFDTFIVPWDNGNG
jgi:prepilin-type N-terminal cleavage/methylation domain-containing protein